MAQGGATAGSGNGLRALWAAVLHQALLEATGGSGVGDGRASARAARGRSEAWFARGGRDFEMVCAFAGVDPDAVRSRWREAAARLVAGAPPAGGARRGPVPGGGGVCAVPGCGVALSGAATSGVCRSHNHAPGHCGCGQCRRVRG